MLRAAGRPAGARRSGKASDDDADAGGPHQPRAPIADRLRYLYIGARARAESVAQQRQPGLIESLVSQQIHVKRYQEDIGRMLFQLMVPHDFKDAARQLDRLVLVVDSYTANLPWELMLADDPAGRGEDRRPLALRTAVVRQFASSRVSPAGAASRQPHRAGDRQSIGRGLRQRVPAGGRHEARRPARHSSQAQAEAESVALTLNGLGYVVPPLGDDARAIDVFAKLYHQPYRILHISAHGVFALRHRDGRLRSGVVLSDGLLITAAEVSAMESVPEVVFLNCCHLGTVDRPTGRGANKLAASVARELIDIGVRCVVVAGWAVDDANAAIFGRTFYKELLLHRRSFGDAVFRARLAVWKVDADDITWGAFQAYGEPGWMAEPRGDGSGAGGPDPKFVSPDELLDALARVRAALSRKTVRQTEAALLAQAEHVQQLIDTRALPPWRSLPEVQSALASTWRQLDQLEKAREAFLAAIQAEGDLGRVPVKDIEQLAETEVLLGERIAQADGSGQSDAQGLHYIELAIARLHRLGDIVSGKVDGESEAHASDRNMARNAQLGSAWEAMAGLFACQLLRDGLDAGQAARIGDKLERALKASVAAYQSAEGNGADGRLNAYVALSRLALDVLTPWPAPELKDAAIALAQRCRQAAAQEFAGSPSVQEAAMQADALLVERLLDGSLGAADAHARQAAFDEVVQAYNDALSNLTVKPSEFEAIVNNIAQLSRFFSARNVVRHEAALQRTARQLDALARRLQPAFGRDRQDGGNGAAEEGEAGTGDALAGPGVAATAEAAPASMAKPAPRSAGQRATAPGTKKAGARTATAKAAPAKRQSKPRKPRRS